jgi:hypothetical protein
MTAPGGPAGLGPAVGLDPTAAPEALDAEAAPDPSEALDASAGPDASAGLGASAGPGASAGLDAAVAPDALRELVREVLREVLPAIADQPNPLNAVSNGSQPAERHIERVARGGPRPASRRVEPVAGGGPRPAARRIERVPGSSQGPAAGSAAAGPGGTVRAVRLASDEELNAFVAEVLRLAGDPRQRHDLLAGRLRFTLAGPPGGRPPGAAAAARRIEKGAVTERAVLAAAKAGERLVLGPRAVLTPLARDKARALGVPVQKER